MDNIIVFLISAFQITLLDIVLSGDNIGVIAMATKNLSEKHAKKASAIGVFVAVLLRIIFASLITYILLIQWLPIKLVGGLLLTKITWDLLKPVNEDVNINVSSSGKFIDAVTSIIIADATMSLDNVLAIAGAANGDISLIIFGLILNIPIIFYGSRYVAKIMSRHPIVVYVGGSVLAHTAFKMLLEDKLIENLIPNVLASAIPNIAAVATLLYGVFCIFLPRKKIVKY